MEMCGSDKDIGKSSNREKRAIIKNEKSNSDRERTTTYKTRGQCKKGKRHCCETIMIYFPFPVDLIFSSSPFYCQTETFYHMYRHV